MENEQTYATLCAHYIAKAMYSDNPINPDLEMLEADIRQHARTIGEAHIIRDRAMDFYYQLKANGECQ